MMRVAIRGLLGRKTRAALTALSIVLGVAMVSGSFVLTDTISKAFDTVFSSAYDHTDAVVSGKKLVDESASGNATVTPALLRRVRGLPDVEAAAGAVLDMQGNSTQAKLIDRNGKVIQKSGNPTFGFGVDPTQPRFNPLQLEAGRWASGAGEVVIDAETGHDSHYGVGDSIEVAGRGPARPYRIVGLARFGGLKSLGGATFAVFSIPTAQRLLGIRGFTAISVAARHGVSQERLVAELRGVVPGGVQVKTGAQQAKDDNASVQSFVSFIRGFLLGFGGIALLVGAFVIFNTMSITIAQRTKELATLRTLGASRRQVLRSVVLESFVLGALASAVGLVSGIGLARGLSALFSALGLALPEASPVYAVRTVVVSLLLGTVVTLLAGVVPAVRATRVPPIAAAKDGLALQPRRRRGVIAGAALLALAVFLLGYATTGERLGSGKSLLALALGTLALLVGTAGVASRLVTALVAVVGWPARRLGGSAGRLASQNAVRNPSRTASTAAALMIGLALVSFVAVLGKGVRGSVDNAVKQQIGADWVLTSQAGWSTFTAAAGDAAARAPGVEQATSIRSDRGLIGKTQVSVNAVDPRTVRGLYRFQWRGGSSDATLARLGGHGALVKETFGKKHHLAVGDRFVLRAPDGRPLALRVIGLFQPPRMDEILGGVVLSTEAFDRTFPRPQDGLTLIRGDVTRAGLAKALAAFPDAKVQTQAEFVKNNSSFVGTMLNMLYVLLALSVVVSLFGMINTLVLSVFERTRELGMLRAVGMSRRQVRRMVRHESVITALIGAGLGLPLGVLLAAAVTHALSRFGLGFAVSVPALAAFTAVAILAGVLAAIAPARRAAKLNVLAALQYE